MRRALRRILVATITLSLFGIAGCPSLCEERSTWASRDTVQCVACERDCRATVSSAPVTGCDEEFACVARCPDRSALTCGCSEQCLPTAKCRAVWDQAIACYASACRDKCR